MHPAKLALAFFNVFLLFFALQPAHADEAAFEFDGQEFFLRSDEGGILEYLTEKETFKNWTTLISVRESDATDDPKAYASKLLENAKESGPDVRGVLMENKEAGSYIVDFLLTSTEGEEPSFVEWNVWRVEAKNGGIEAIQYARRYHDFNEKFGQEIADSRKPIIGELAEFEVPQAHSSGATSSQGSSTEEMQSYNYPSEDSPAFTMEVPADWNLESDDKGAFVVSADKMFTTSVVVVDSSDAEDAVESIKKQSGARFENIVWNEGLAEAKGVKHKVGVYLFSKKDAEKSFVLSTWTPEEAVNQNADGFMKMFTSIKLK